MYAFIAPGLRRLAGPSAAAFLALVCTALLSACDTNMPVLPAPEIVGPADGVVLTARPEVLFEWTPVEGAAVYDLELEFVDEPALSELFLAVTPRVLKKLSGLGLVRWRVRALTDGEEGEWSETRTLTIEGTALEAVATYGFGVSTAGARVGDVLEIPSPDGPLDPLWSAMTAAGHDPGNLRAIVAQFIRVTLVDPGVERLIDFDPIEIAISAGGSTVTLGRLLGPISSSEVTAVLSFEQNDASLLLDGASPGVLLRLGVLPRTPQEETGISVEAEITYTLVIEE